MPKSVRKNRRAEYRADFGRRSRRQTGRQNSIFFQYQTKKKLAFPFWQQLLLKYTQKSYFQNEILKKRLEISESAKKMKMLLEKYQQLF